MSVSEHSNFYYRRKLSSYFSSALLPPEVVSCSVSFPPHKLTFAGPEQQSLQPQIFGKIKSIVQLKLDTPVSYLQRIQDTRGTHTLSGLDYKIYGENFKIIKDYIFIHFLIHSFHSSSLRLLILSAMTLQVFGPRSFLGIS